MQDFKPLPESYLLEYDTTRKCIDGSIEIINPIRSLEKRVLGGTDNKFWLAYLEIRGKSKARVHPSIQEIIKYKRINNNYWKSQEE
ncbi:hypothetical protein H6G33_10045 [Calothrix sp. FACHB-1219]|uniref:hypothetical protein n=1 Tax=unclassified Calothrix TaxID=2619626 RepID=UPI001682E94E|nr:MULTISPECIES: hypothetical protein [unclassified Calothrix]MBD2201688.1 hypothetical protein [Calothrix sp. FACHB-168]MBD2217374.1 hypothetical protein [Calothrix sp. FACHB-1219]